MSTHRYEAFWIPGLDTDFDADEALRLGFEWLEDSPHSPVIAMNAATMVHNRPLLESAGARYPVVSQRTRRWSGGRSPHAVLAVWPTVETLEFAEGLAFNGGLCVIPGTLDEMSPWIARTGALNLADPEATLPSGPSLPADMKHDLDLTLGFDGRKQFLGGGGKEHAIRTLRRIASSPQRPSPADIEAYALASGQTGYQGARRLAAWYRGILEGRSFKDYSGRRI